MPSTLTYPGVYIEEIPSGVRTIVGVATSITAFIGSAPRGPVNIATTITSYADYERSFGGLDLDSPMSFAVRDFFQNGGSQAVIVRLFNPSKSADDPDAKSAATEVFGAIKDATDATDAAKRAEKTAKEYAADAAATPPRLDEKKGKAAADAVFNAVKLAATGQGRTELITSLKKMITDGNYVPAIKTELDKLSAAADAVEASKGPKEVATAIRTAANLLQDPAKTEAIKLANKIDVQVLDGLTRVRVAAASEAAKQSLASKSEFEIGVLPFQAKYEGAWGAALRGEIKMTPNVEIAESLGIAPTDLFSLTVLDASPGGATERFANLTVNKDSQRRIDKVLRDESRLLEWNGDGPPTGTETVADSSDDVTQKATALDEAQKAFRKLQFSGEADENELAEAEANVKNAKAELTDAIQLRIAATDDGIELADKNLFPDGGEQDKKGVYALEQTDLFNLLCVPPYQYGDLAKDVGSAALQALAAYCAKRRAMLIVDSPHGWDTEDGRLHPDLKSKPTDKLGEIGISGPNARNAALYFPRTQYPNPLNGRIEEFAPCGIIAGQYASTDVSRGVWKAPAGLDAALIGVVALAANMTDAENGLLNPLGINCLRSFPVSGRVVWGARTLRGADGLADEYKYVPVRRTALYIEESLYRGTQWAVFEPNDEPLWAQLRLNIGSFMHDLFRQGAFQGRSPREAYFVKCDKETTTQSDINKGIVNVVVGFAPLKPAEFVVIKLQQIAGQLET